MQVFAHVCCCAGVDLLNYTSTLVNVLWEEKQYERCLLHLQDVEMYIDSFGEKANDLKTWLLSYYCMAELKAAVQATKDKIHKPLISEMVVKAEKFGARALSLDDICDEDCEFARISMPQFMRDVGEIYLELFAVDAAVSTAEKALQW